MGNDAPVNIYLQSLGCDKNLVDSEIMLGLLRGDGFTLVNDEAAADAILVNTCGFIQNAVEEGIEAILALAALKSGRCKALVVTGCMAQRYGAQMRAEIPEIDALVGVNDFHDIAAIVRGALNGKKETYVDTPVSRDILCERLYEERVLTAPTHVACVKIAEGCDNRCTYCAIPVIRGRYRSREKASVVAECKRLVALGARELVLVAQDTARYGIDLYGAPKLHDLLYEIADIPDLTWIRILYAYPEHMYPALVDAIAALPKVCKYLDMPIQHSHDAVLKRMGRRGNHAGLVALINDLRARVPDIILRTTLITGFPGETDEEFNHLLAFVRTMRFNQLGVFAYSKEDGTPAARMKPQVRAPVKKARRDAVMRAQAEIAEAWRRGLIGQVLTVMVDGTVTSDGGETVYVGRGTHDAYETDGGVYFASRREWMSGDTVNIRITAANGYDMHGIIVGEE
jgi:ribosomal protein S12 methylthiotransferase